MALRVVFLFLYGLNRCADYATPEQARLIPRPSRNEFVCTNRQCCLSPNIDLRYCLPLVASAAPIFAHRIHFCDLEELIDESSPTNPPTNPPGFSSPLLCAL